MAIKQTTWSMPIKDHPKPLIKTPKETQFHIHTLKKKNTNPQETTQKRERERYQRNLPSGMCWNNGLEAIFDWLRLCSRRTGSLSLSLSLSLPLCDEYRFWILRIWTGSHFVSESLHPQRSDCFELSPLICV